MSRLRGVFWLLGPFLYVCSQKHGVHGQTGRRGWTNWQMSLGLLSAPRTDTELKRQEIHTCRACADHRVWVGQLDDLKPQVEYQKPARRPFCAQITWYIKKCCGLRATILSLRSMLLPSNTLSAPSRSASPCSLLCILAPLFLYLTMKFHKCQCPCPTPCVWICPIFVAP